MTQRKKEILEVAEQIFREKGYDSASMRDIAKACGLEPASLYSHFESKNEMLRTICFELADKFELAIREVNDIYFNAEEKLQMAVQSHIEVLTENLNASVVFLRDWRHLEEGDLSEFISKRDTYEEGIIQIVKEGIYEEKFAETDPKFAALTILSSVNWIVEWYKEDGPLSPKEIAEKLINFILTGLYKNHLVGQKI
jgi:AcrR family transcriptional regulator